MQYECSKNGVSDIDAKKILILSIIIYKYQHWLLFHDATWIWEIYNQIILERMEYQK